MLVGITGIAQDDPDSYRFGGGFLGIGAVSLFFWNEKINITYK